MCVNDFSILIADINNGRSNTAQDNFVFLNNKYESKMPSLFGYVFCFTLGGFMSVRPSVLKSH